MKQPDMFMFDTQVNANRENMSGVYMSALGQDASQFDESDQ